MNSTEYANHILTQLLQANVAFRAPPLSEMQKRNAGAIMKEIVVQRLSSGGTLIESQKGSRYSWDSGIILSRNSRVGVGFWSNMPSSQIISLQQIMFEKSAVFLFCHFDVENGLFHAWAIPDSVAIKSIVTIPDGQSGLKTLYIEVGKHRFKHANYSPDLEPFYRQVELTTAELESLTAGVKQDSAAKELSNTPVEDDVDDADFEVADDERYSEATVDFVSALPSHTTDKEWHKRNRERYQQVLRSPTSSLVESLRTNCIAELDADVANTTHNISVLKKNDFGRGGFYQHYWAAFYDPESGSKTKSCQLFLILFGSQRLFRYGFSFGRDCDSYKQNLHKALSENVERVCKYLREASPDVQVALSETEEQKGMEATEFASLLMSSITENSILTGAEPITI